MDEGNGARVDKLNWWSLIFSVFVVFIFLDPYQRHAGWLEWTLTSLGVLVFLGLYAAGISSLARKKRSLWLLAGVTLLGVVFAPFNAGSFLYFIYAASFVPFVVEGNLRRTAVGIALLVAILSLESWLLHYKLFLWAYGVAYMLVIGAGNTWAARQSAAVERLAKTAERERIARDLHDVLGHTLSVITLKAELAGKLLERDIPRAKAEIADVERISREALAEVRQTIRGYREESLPVEFERARSILESAGVAVDSHPAKVGITPAQEGVLALVLREAVTNVVRHAQAKTCRLELQESAGVCHLVVEDDGRGGMHPEGYGMRGMRERVEALGGTLLQDVSAGTRLTVTLPLA